jgi:hypothetical protein
MTENAGNLVMKYASFHPHNIRLLNITFFILIIAFITLGCGGGGGGGGGDDGDGPTPDTTAPTVPADVNAITVSTSKINVTWSESRDNKGVNGYRIIRTVPLPEEELTVLPSTGTNYTHTDLTVNVKYCYKVTAFDDAGNESDRSSETCAATSLVASDASAGDQFGFSVAISGEYAIVGAQNGDSGMTDTGAAYIYRRTDPDTWDEGVKIVADDADEFDRFGWSVAINGDFAIVGARFDDEAGDQAGAAYIFQRTGPNMWDTGTKILAQDTEKDDDFGISVAISNAFAVVGATGDDDAAFNSGAIYIYQKTGNSWTFRTKIPSHDAGSSDLFGISVAISGDYIIVGATLTEAAYIYHWTGSTWDFMKRITAPPIVTQGDFFGITVAIDGEYALAGAWAASQGDGAAYIFKRTGSAWDSGVKIVASDAAENANFGKSVSIKGDYAIVGADTYDAEAGLTNAGAVYIFQRIGPDNTWDTGTRILAVDFEKDAFFGNAVTISNDRAIVGSLLKRAGGSSTGAAYILDIPPG